jgi:hypothetical protein
MRKAREKRKGSDRWGALVALAFLFASGIILILMEALWLSEGKPARIARGFGDAFVIAGALGLFVDLHVKRRFAKEISRSTFRGLLGKELPDSYAERIWKIFGDAERYIEDFRWDIAVSPLTIDAKETLRVTVHYVSNGKVISREGWRPFGYRRVLFPSMPGQHSRYTRITLEVDDHPVANLDATQLAGLHKLSDDGWEDLDTHRLGRKLRSLRVRKESTYRLEEEATFVLRTSDVLPVFMTAGVIHLTLMIDGRSCPDVSFRVMTRGRVHSPENQSGRLVYAFEPEFLPQESILIAWTK